MSGAALPAPGGPVRARWQAAWRILPFATFMAVLALRGALPSGGDFDLRWLYAAQAGGALVWLAACWPRYGELRAGPLSASALAASVLLGLAVFAAWIAPAPSWALLGEPSARFVPLDTGGTLQWGLIALRAAGAVLVVPVMEELFWRSFLMRWIDRRDFLALAPQGASAFAVLSSSAVFALAHDRWLVALLAGLAYALTYRRGRRLWYAVAAHASTNLALAIWVVAGGHWSYW